MPTREDYEDFERGEFWSRTMVNVKISVNLYSKLAEEFGMDRETVKTLCYSVLFADGGVVINPEEKCREILRNYKWVKPQAVG